MLIIISFPSTTFIVDGTFENISIALGFSSFSFSNGFVILVIASPMGSFVFCHSQGMS
jgi:hypothetical protein